MFRVAHLWLKPVLCQDLRENMSRETRLEIKRLQKQMQRQGQCDLSVAVLQVALAMWYLDDRDATMAHGWLAKKYTELQCKKKKKAPDQPKPLAHKIGAQRDLLDLPASWIDKFSRAIEDWSPADEENIRNRSGHWLKHVKQAEALKLDATLVDWARKQTMKGRSVSTRAILNRKRDVHMLLDGAVREQCAPLQKKDVSWVRRWAARHGLRRGRFAHGAGFSRETKIRKANGVQNFHPSRSCKIRPVEVFGRT